MAQTESLQVQMGVSKPTSTYTYILFAQVAVLVHLKRFCLCLAGATQGGLDMVYAHVTLIAFLILYSMIVRERANIYRVYRDARSRTSDRTGAERGASLS